MSENIHFPSYSREMTKILNNSAGKTSSTVDKEEAEQIVIDYLSKHKISELETADGGIETHTLTKKDMRKVRDRTKALITDCIFSNSITIRNAKVDEFIEEMTSEYGGYSSLDEAFEDDGVSDIYCLEWNKIFVEKNGRNIPYWKTFRSENHYDKFVERFLAINGKELNIGDKKIVDAEIYGDRICATSKAVTPNGISLTIRKHKEVHITLDEMMEQHVMTDEMMELFGLIIDGESNLIYAGITGSGKTTTIRALLDFFVTKNGKRMVVCEDTQELFPKNPHTMEMISTKSDKENLSISLYDLIITGLRLKPKYIVVGEVRGVEAAAAVEAMETGHSTIFTMHGGTVWNNINRLTTKSLMAMPTLGTDVVERIIGAAVDFVAIQDDVPGWGRVVSTMDEISYDFDEKKIKVKHIFKFDQKTKEFVFMNRISPEKADKMMRRGVPYERIQKWIMEGENGIPNDNDKEFVKLINETYLAEKEERHRKYRERAEDRKKKCQTGLKAGPTTEKEQASELIDMLQKLDQLKVATMTEKIKSIEKQTTENS